MALVRAGSGIVDIRGGFGGVYFHRDKSGLHQCSKPRNIQQSTPGQKAQRGAFIKSRAYSKINRFVSYNVYRVLNGLAPRDPPFDYYPDMR